MTTEPLVQYEKDARGVVTLTMNRPQAFNSLSEAMIESLQAALDRVAADESARVVVLAGAGKAFCAGHDLKEMRGNHTKAFMQALFRLCGKVMMQIVNMPQPVARTVSGSAGTVTYTALRGVPMVRPGEDIASIIISALQTSNDILVDGDILVIAQKIVSKSEGRTVELATVTPSARALELAAVVQKDARLVELVLRESKRIVRTAKDVLIVEHRRGYVMANAGIDQSNVATSGLQW